MLVTNFRLKYLLYRVVLSGYQLLDTGRLHPLRERAIRALSSSVDYIDLHMPQAIGFDSQKELIDFALEQARSSGHYLEFGVFSGGTIRHIARRKRAAVIHGFDSFEGLPEPWSGFTLGQRVFSRGGHLPRVAATCRACRPMSYCIKAGSRTRFRNGAARPTGRSPLSTSIVTFIHRQWTS